MQIEIPDHLLDFFLHNGSGAEAVTMVAGYIRDAQRKQEAEREAAVKAVRNDDHRILNDETLAAIAQTIGDVAADMAEQGAEWAMQLNSPGSHDDDEARECARLGDASNALAMVHDMPMVIDYVLRACRQHGVTL